MIIKTFTLISFVLILLLNNIEYAFSGAKLHPVVHKGKMVYIDTTGKIVLDDDYETDFELGHIGIEGYSNTGYPIYVFPEYAYFSENKVTVKRSYGFWFIKLGTEYEVIDILGNTVIKPSDKFVGRFSNNLTTVKIPLKSFDYIYDEKYTFIDTTGNYVLITDCDTNNPDIYYSQDINKCLKTFKYAGDFSEGWAIVLSNNKYNFIDVKGNYLCRDGYDDVKPFKDGIAPAKFNSKWGMVNSEGKWVIEPKYVDLWHFNDGFARFYDGKYFGFVDKSGKTVFENKYQYVNDFSDGYAVVKIGEWEYNYLDPKGNLVLKNHLMIASNFQEKLARVMVNGKWGFIDTNLDYFIEPIYDFATDYRDGFAYIWKGNNMMIINKQKEVIWTYKFEKK